MKKDVRYLSVDKSYISDFDKRCHFRKCLKEARTNKQNAVIFYDEVFTLERLLDHDRYFFDSEGQINITFEEIPKNH